MRIIFGIIKNLQHRCLAVGNRGMLVIKNLFEEILKKTGQVNIMVRDVKGVDDNPFDFETVKKNIFRGP